MRHQVAAQCSVGRIGSTVLAERRLHDDGWLSVGRIDGVRRLDSTELLVE